jgi:hypothetical protein
MIVLGKHYVCRTREKLAELSASLGGQLSYAAFSLHTLGKILNCSNVVDKIVCSSLHCRHFDQSYVKKLGFLIG